MSRRPAPDYGRPSRGAGLWLIVAIALLFAAVAAAGILAAIQDGHDEPRTPAPAPISAAAPSPAGVVRGHEDASEAYNNPQLQALAEVPTLSDQQAELADQLLQGAAPNGCGPNGFIKKSCLRKIAGGQMLKAPAAALNALNVKARHVCHLTITPGGPLSSYRNYKGQAFLWRTSPHAYDTNWKAKPGTSNHGWGLAIDLATRAMRACVDRIGAYFGFSKKLSDAPLEWWHLRWVRGRWHGINPGPYGKAKAYLRSLCKKRSTRRSRRACLRRV